MSRATICDRCDTVMNSDETVTLLKTKETEKPDQQMHGHSESKFRDLCEGCGLLLEEFMDGTSLDFGDETYGNYQPAAANVQPLPAGWAVTNVDDSVGFSFKRKSYMDEENTRNY